MHRRRIVVGNWKMNGRLTSGLTLAQDLVKKAELNRPEGYDLVICPPFTLSWPVSEVVVGTPVHLGAQDCHVDTHGAFTGDVSAAMLVDVGCRYVILGHSERRRDHGETDALVQKKIQAAHQAGLTAVVCVGESRQ
ncbi:MAG: triosephosphate isomerase, partial [Alphaproteobacteria bacterium]|nr:triosephosphate isomerase [Alphaproteobacteria bacterium]